MQEKTAEEEEKSNKKGDNAQLSYENLETNKKSQTNKRDFRVHAHTVAV